MSKEISTFDMNTSRYEFVVKMLQSKMVKRDFDRNMAKDV